MRKFKPGDKVRVIKTSTKCRKTSTCCLQFINSIGTVIDSYWTSPKAVSVNGFPHTKEWCSGFSEDCLELVTQDWDK